MLRRNVNYANCEPYIRLQTDLGHFLDNVTPNNLIVLIYTFGSIQSEEELL